MRRNAFIDPFLDTGCDKNTPPPPDQGGLVHSVIRPPRVPKQRRRAGGGGAALDFWGEKSRAPSTLL